MKNPNQQLTRRDVLTRSAKVAGTTALIGMPTVIPSGVLAMPGRPGPNDRIVYGHIGLGGMGSSHIVADSCAALCDVDQNHLKTRAENVRKVNDRSDLLLTDDYRRVLERKDIDAVTIGTPDHWHAIMTVHALQAGKHVYSEKPTCCTIQEGQAMVNAAKRYNKAVQIGAQGRSAPVVAQAVAYIRNGMLGKVSRVEIWHPNNFVDKNNWGQEQPVPSHMNWEMWLGPMRWRPYNPAIVHFNFRWLMESGAGFIRDRGNHALNVVMWAMDADKKGPVSVEATGKPNPNSVYDAPLTMDVTWEFKDPDWTLIWRQPGTPNPRFKGEWGATYTGDKDDLVILGGDGGADTEPKAKEFKVPAGGFTPFVEPTEADATERHRRNWRRCIKEGGQPVVNAEIGYNIIILPIIANISYQLGRKLRWDPKKHEFIGDEEANRLLARPYRAPWTL